MTPTPQRVEGLRGMVRRGPLGAGSKSEREAVWLDTACGRYVLRRKDGPTFGDTSLEAWVGHSVACSGFIVDYVLLAERIEASDGAL
jgi:hypothetical protein